MKGMTCILAAACLFVVGCGGDGDSKPQEPSQEDQSSEEPSRPPLGSTFANVSLAATSVLPNVKQLDIRVKPVTLHRSDGNYKQIITDDNFNNGPRSEPCGYDGQGQWVCEPVNDYTTVNLWRTDRINGYPLNNDLVAIRNEVPPGEYTDIEVSTINVANERDSYLRLDDERECEITGVRLDDGTTSLRFDLEQTTIRYGETVSFGLAVDLSSTVIDPARCAEGYELQAKIHSVLIERRTTIVDDE